jgi:AMMECR1 domain-containing protein
MISAFNDSRFKPITLKDLPSLNVSVSLLINFEKGKKAL